jgi:L-phenylalanine/L-methionine N-acetyltransferase
MTHSPESNGAAAVAAVAANPGGIVVRAREPADLDALAELTALPGVRYGTLLPSFMSPVLLAERFGTKKEREIGLCATIAGRVVGQLGLIVHPGRRAHSAMFGIMVHDDYRGRGVGSALVAAALDCADRSLGLRRIELTVFADNAPAIALYRKSGFVEEGRSRGYAMRDGKLVDALHMARFASAPPFARE